MGREESTREEVGCGGSTIPGEVKAFHKKHRPHIKVGKDAEEEEELYNSKSTDRRTDG